MALSEDFLAAVTFATGFSAKFDKSRPRTLDEALQDVLVIDDEQTPRPLTDDEKIAVRRWLGQA
jgi:hypothetical protein